MLCCDEESLDREQCERSRRLTQSADNRHEAERLHSVQAAFLSASRRSEQTTKEDKEFRERSRSHAAGGPVREPANEDAAARRTA